MLCLPTECFRFLIVLILYRKQPYQSSCRYWPRINEFPEVKVTVSSVLNFQNTVLHSNIPVLVLVQLILLSIQNISNRQLKSKIEYRQFQKTTKHHLQEFPITYTSLVRLKLKLLDANNNHNHSKRLTKLFYMRLAFCSIARSIYMWLICSSPGSRFSVWLLCLESIK